MNKLDNKELSNRLIENLSRKINKDGKIVIYVKTKITHIKINSVKL